MPKLDGKVAVITGATSGMALATAKLFVAEGAHVFITGRRKDNWTRRRRDRPQGNGRAGGLRESARPRSAGRDRAGAARTSRRPLASAGLASVSDPLGSITPDTFDDVVGVNFRGTVFTVQYLLPL